MQGFKNRNLITGITDEVLNIFMEYDWHGNVRELENCIERAFSLGVEGKINVNDLPDTIHAPSSRGSAVFNSNKSTMSDY